MAIWAFIYLTLLSLSSLYSMKILRQVPFFWLGEALALACIYAFFIFSYNPEYLPQNLLVIILMTLYVLYWQSWVYKNFFASIIKQTGAGTKELIITMLVTFFPLIYIVVDVYTYYFQN